MFCWFVKPSCQRKAESAHSPSPLAVESSKEASYGVTEGTRRPHPQEERSVLQYHAWNSSLQVIVADTDELFTYGTATLKEAIAQMEADGATYALGEMLDHISRNGSITELKVQSLQP